MRIFAAAGGGYGVLNNPNGPLDADPRGWYPLTQRAIESRRLNVALDAGSTSRGHIGTVTQMALTLGYDRF